MFRRKSFDKNNKMTDYNKVVLVRTEENSTADDVRAKDKILFPLAYLANSIKGNDN